MTTIGTYFSGGGLVEVGAMAAGFKPAFAVECDPDNPKLSAAIADCYERNIGHPVIRRPAQAINPGIDLPRVHWFHASPPCKRASLANNDGEESPADLEMADAVALYIARHQPNFVTIENVWGYRQFESWRLIAKTLLAGNYGLWLGHVNMANHGIPQTRRRMIAIAALDGALPWPEQTHAERPDRQQRLLGHPLLPWVGWYEAIADLIPGLPETRPARWQLERLPAEIAGHQLVMTANTNIQTEAAGRTRALLLDGQLSEGTRLTMRDGDEPSMVVCASHDKRGARALLISNAATEYGDGLRLGPEPAHTVTREAAGRTRALLYSNRLSFDQDGNEYGMSARAGDEPSQTVRSNCNGIYNASLPGLRWVKITPRCLARFQSVPDSYDLPASNAVACAVVGNGVPPLFAQRLGEAICP
jgi:DNA (cytosine-5)-methyltransferase 1